MKQCCKCKQWKDESEFHRNKSNRDGLTCHCKECRSKTGKIYTINNADKIAQYRIDHKEKRHAYDKEYYHKNKAKRQKYLLENKERISERSRKYYRNNKKKRKEYNKKYTKEHPAENTYRTRKRQITKIKATPSYADEKAIKRIYRTAHILSKMTGREFHVDHIIPLTSKLVCGLHHQDNLQILSAERNRSKSNKFEPIIIDY